ncbi:BREX system P-loop protein BrxC [Methanosarcina mazei]|uniref:BREX system P-loop protein BrxC n=1 Tax=Methanosarcina mazei TaxID=2209 RepID=UPI0015865821|nr:BREX system P-loop protein BrxC [Methanosarcina mazei]
MTADYDQKIISEIEKSPVDNKIANNLIDFLERYNGSELEYKKDTLGYVTGFFGYDNSCFAKILGYLLENKQTKDGKYVRDIFLERIRGLEQEEEIKILLHEASLKTTNHVIMYQIESVHDQLAESKSITLTLYKQFMRYMGLSEDLKISELEQGLIAQGKYEEFKEKIKEISGKEWEEVRKSSLFSKKPISRALFSLFPENFSSIEEAQADFEKRGNMGLDIIKVAKRIESYIRYLETDKKEKFPHIVFVIDEVGQYIGDSDDLLLELQTLAEDFGKIGLGKIWLIITAQESLDQIIESVKKKEGEYKKIMDRFDTKLHLTSENIVEVLEERILKKKESSKEEITKIYHDYEGIIAYASKMENPNRPMANCSEEGFVKVYPFLPYQLEITQQIFASIRTKAGHGIKLTGAERSMLGVTQSVLKSPETGIKNSELGRIVSFDKIFDQISTELPGDILRDINNVKINERVGLRNVDIELAKKVVKTVYLLQQLKWIPTSLSNISRAMLENLNIDFTFYESQVKDALDSLIESKYVVLENGQYEYISGSKKLIEEEIFREEVKTHQKKRFSADQLNIIISSLNRLHYDEIKYFDIKLYGDDNEISSKGDIILKVYSPISLEYGNVELGSVISESHKTTDTVYWLPNPNPEIEKDIDRYLRTLQVVERKEKVDKRSEEENVILKEKKQVLESLKVGIQASIRKSLLIGNIVYDGNNEQLTGKSEKIETIFKRELSKVIPFIYTQFDDAEFKVNEKSIKTILTAKSDLNQIEKDLDLFDSTGNINLHGKIAGEIYSFIKKANDKGEILTGAGILDNFEDVPYGWDVILVRIVVAALYRSGSIYLKFSGKDYYDHKKPEAQDLLTDSRKFRKTSLWIEPDVALTPHERDKIKQELDIIFNIKTDDTINSLSRSIEDQMGKMKIEYEKQTIYWKENGYELNPTFYSIKDTCDMILSETNPSKILKKFLGITAQTRQEYDYLEKIKDFTERKDSQLLASIKRLPQLINVSSETIDPSILEAYEGYIREINTIVSNKEIVEKWSTVTDNYNKAVEKYKVVYEILHTNRDSFYKSLKEEVSRDPVLSKNVKGDTFDIIEPFLCSDNIWLSEELKCDKCKNSLAEIDNHILSKNNKRDKIISKILAEKQPIIPPKGGQGEGKKPQQQEKQKKQVNMNLRLCSGKTIITDENDLKDILKNIEDEAIEHLKRGEVIILT